MQIKNKEKFCVAGGLGATALVLAMVLNPTPVTAVALPSTVPPPLAELKSTLDGKWDAMSSRVAQDASDRAIRYLAVEGVLEEGTAGLHVAHPWKQMSSNTNPSNPLSSAILDYDWYYVFPAINADAQFTDVFIYPASQDLGEISDYKRVSISRVVRNSQLGAEVVGDAGGGYTLRLTFSDRALTALSELMGPVVMPTAGYDWARNWLQAGDVITQYHAVLVSSQATLGHISVRDLIQSGGSSVVVDPLRTISLQEATDFAALLN